MGESKKRDVTCGLGEWAWDLTRGWSVTDRAWGRLVVKNKYASR